jgi:hypothetical protein
MASVDAKPDPAVFRVIRKIVVPTGPGAMMHPQEIRGNR